MATKNLNLRRNNPLSSGSAALAETAGGLLRSGEPAILITVVSAEGSTPRDANTAMIVTREACHGTIGGGQLEFIVTDAARKMLAGAGDEKEQTISLGPDIGQCCGGRVKVRFERLTGEAVNRLREDGEGEKLPEVHIHGAGHTGTALAAALSLLPIEVSLIDSRKEQLQNLTSKVQTVLTPLPEELVGKARAGTAFIVLTHEHSLDFLIAAEALKRGDAAYVGMIGSKTKRAVFKRWLEENGYDAALAANLVCPIGSSTIRDKRPEVIAALVAAELISIFAGKTGSD